MVFRGPDFAAKLGGMEFSGQQSAIKTCLWQCIRRKMGVRYYRDLIVWQKSMDLTVSVYKIVKLLPKEEMYSLSDQMRRAVVSIPSNIAEGQQRDSEREFIHFLSIAKGSLAELETQLLLCERLNYINNEQIRPILAQCHEIGKMINGLMNNIQ